MGDPVGLMVIGQKMTKLLAIEISKMDLGHPVFYLVKSTTYQILQRHQAVSKTKSIHMK